MGLQRKSIHSIAPSNSHTISSATRCQFNLLMAALAFAVIVTGAVMHSMLATETSQVNDHLIISRKVDTNTGEKNQDACEGDKITLTCNEGQIIKVKDAQYCPASVNCPGRCGSGQGKRVCPAAANHSRTLTRVKKDCASTPSCKIEANNANFDDPCTGVVKCLSVTYQCLPE